MILKGQSDKITLEQTKEYEFLNELVGVLDSANLGAFKMDFKKTKYTTDDIYGLRYRILVRNYHIECQRTPVLYRPHFFSSSRWKLEEGKFERFETYVFEVMQSRYVTEMNDIIHGGRVVGRDPHSGEEIFRHPGYATAFMHAAMATDKGHYPTICFDEHPREMFIKQNLHLFPVMSRLFKVLQREWERRDNKVVPGAPDKYYDWGGCCLDELRVRALSAIRSELKVSQK